MSTTENNETPPQTEETPPTNTATIVDLQGIIHKLKEENASLKLISDQRAQELASLQHASQQAVAFEELAKTTLLNTKLELAIHSAGALNPSIVTRLIDKAKLEIDIQGQQVKGIDDALSALKVSDPYLFRNTSLPTTTTTQAPPPKSKQEPPEPAGPELTSIYRGRF